MKVIALVILVVAGTSSGLGSGPYLPSGWKPAGPAFYLPTEVEKPVAIPLKDVSVQETETSGSSFLREYGPPQLQVVETEAGKIQEVSQDITQQALPDPVTEQAFVVIETKSISQDEANAEITQEAVTEVVEKEITTESQTTEEETTKTAALVEEIEIESQTESSLAAEEESTEKLAEVTEVEKTVTEVTESEKIVEEAAVTQEVAVAEVQQDSENSNSNLVATVEQKSEEVAEVKAVEEGVKNIAEALVNLENEIKAQQVQTNEEVSEVKTVVEGSVQTAPEGFLEYGPPGFTEYGPPKGDLRVTEENSDATNEINETRRRRFSPKFKTTKRKH